jgi:hypothetical protein
MDSRPQIAFRVGKHVPGESGNLLRPETRMTGCALGSGLSQEGPEVSRLATGEGLGLLGEAHELNPFDIDPYTA